MAADGSASIARGGVASTSGRHAEAAWEGWNHFRRQSPSRLHAVQEQLGAAVANSVWCSPAGQVSCICCAQSSDTVIRAGTVSHAMCAS